MLYYRKTPKYTEESTLKCEERKNKSHIKVASLECCQNSQHNFKSQESLEYCV